MEINKLWVSKFFMVLIAIVACGAMFFAEPQYYRNCFALICALTGIHNVAIR
ncbi:hypothetical protein phiAS5_ORF0198 [Aeromonas phage phiAS5]|uniref:Uncharacterized protein n=1 Tax=Aeromonas phage phiAS5 TaxID=879630 RepID=E1A2U5_9CAUD|nr:hypothetical protein phiAS5_ORF0198 [Aeromonas phage phiAS5]ADM80041.1 hypothetical protein phiAS5_ORF0198 [Aeromonas phage phiAS5]